MSEYRIPYDDMVQNALLGVVRQVLADTAKNGLSGAHHFYIAFRTDHPGVSVPAYLKERYKEEMTIVLQNQFWDLKVEDDHFEVGLSFNRKPAMLSIPFAAVTGFLDPSVEFGLQFQRNIEQDAGENDGKVTPSVKKATPRKASPAEEAAEGAEAGSSAGNNGGSDDDTPPAGPAGSDDNIVALDAFRKKK